LTVPAPSGGVGDEFTDCSGTTNFLLTSLEEINHNGNFDGPFKQDDWFTDLHITFLDAGVTVDPTFTRFDNISDGNVAWNTEIMGNMVSFTAPTSADRVDGDASGVAGDEYDWRVLINGATGLNELRVRIEYTMDVPEPSTALLSGVGLTALAFAARRRRPR
jgi:hypothetical protein